MRASRALLMAVLAGLVVSACAGPAAAAEEIRSSAPRGSADAAAAAKAAAALDAFATDLYRELAKKEGNLVLSPYSVAVALAMARAGAAGETAAQMDAVLYAALAGDLDAGYNALDQALATRSGKFKVGDQTLELELATANRLWGQKGFTFEQAFLDRLAASYGAGMQIVDYKAAPEASRKTINAWVEERTRGRIVDLIPQGVIDALTRLVLTNAIYLKASWLYRFGDATAAPFTLADGSSVQAQLMPLSEGLQYGRGDGYQAVQLPYAGGLAMIALVPDAGTLAAFEASLDGTKLRAIVGGLRSTRVDLWLPKFSYRTEASLKDTLGVLGMPVAFTGEADFSGITKEAPLEIADVLHQAFIAVDEKGTEAAAATAVVMRETAAPADQVELRIDRPFLYLIQDTATGAILFMGRVSDPTKS